jgi:hypothetical protein
MPEQRAGRPAVESEALTTAGTEGRTSLLGRLREDQRWEWEAGPGRPVEDYLQ